MNKKVLGLLVLGLSISAVLLPQAAQASEREADTGVGIGFATDDDNTIIEGPYDKALSLINKPTAFKFGKENELSDNGGMFYNQNTDKQYIAVYEDRDADKQTGWELKAKMSELTNPKDSTQKLSTTLSFNAKSLSTFTIDKVDGKIPTPEKLPDVLAAYTGVNITGSDLVELKANEEKAVMTATKAEVGGIAAEIKDVQLAVAKAQKDLASGNEFTGTLHWSLVDAE